MICCLPAYTDSIKCSRCYARTATYVLCANVLLPIPRSDVNNVNTSPGASSSGTVATGSVLVERPHSTKTDYNIGLPSFNAIVLSQVLFPFHKNGPFSFNLCPSIVRHGSADSWSPYFLTPDYLKTRTDGRTDGGVIISFLVC